ncbi:MAG: sortase [Patescibacteria group bacterium]|nr:sortase [Patescibacteria group bacterium]
MDSSQKIHINVTGRGNSHHQKPPHDKPSKKRSLWVSFFQFVGLFVFFFLISALIIMGPTLYAQVNFLFAAPRIEETNENLGLPVAAPDYETIAPKLDTPNKVIPKDNRIVIPKIDVDAPIVFVPKANNQIILESIKEGVAHYPGTALPGRAGNVFLTGHSSYYWWSGGQYNQVFALLYQLDANDLVYIYYEGEEYIYKMRDSIVVLPTQTEVLKQTTTATLSVMTCTPIGTNLKRLIVRADLISSPDVDTRKIDEFSKIPSIPVFLPLY